MTLNEMTAALNARTDEYGDTLHFGSDYAGVYDISRDQAERIAAKSNSVEDFESIWENEDWWV